MFQPSELKRRRIAIDLFCGCGGLSLGLIRAGFQVVAAIDIDKLAVSTYKQNHPDTITMNRDIRGMRLNQFMQRLKLKAGELDLIAGCPPCQGFSRLRTLNGTRDVSDTRNDLVLQFVRFVRVLRPKAIMIENVPALMDDQRLQRLRVRLDRLQYKTDAKIFDAADFGIPQRRRRMLLVGALDEAPAFPASSTRRTVSQAIRKLEAPEDSIDPAHNYSVRRAARVMSLIRQISKDGGSRAELPAESQLECHKRLDGFRDVYGRMSWGEQAPTITGGCINPSKGRFLHPDQDRAITLREAAMLQGFPKDYWFDLSRGRYPAAEMIGNAFPPKFAEHHARAIYRHLEGVDAAMCVK